MIFLVIRIHSTSFASVSRTHQRAVTLSACHVQVRLFPNLHSLSISFTLYHIIIPQPFTPTTTNPQRYLLSTHALHPQNQPLHFHPCRRATPRPYGTSLYHSQQLCNSLFILTFPSQPLSCISSIQDGRVH